MASLKGSHISLSLCVNDMLMHLSIISWGNDTCNEMISLVGVKLVIPSLQRLSRALIPWWQTKDGCSSVLLECHAHLIVGEKVGGRSKDSQIVMRDASPEEKLD